jgi:hypothetical protein
MDEEFLKAAAAGKGGAGIIGGACATIAIGAAAYGFAFGAWRSALQGVYSAVKMPLLFFATVLATASINTMIAQLLGAGLSMRAVCRAFVLSMAIAAAILGALSPVALFFALQMPPPDPAFVGLSPAAAAGTPCMRAYWALLLGHVTVIGAAGLVGNVRLYHYLRFLTGTRRAAVRLVAIWTITTGFVGCQLSWAFSPFLCKPTQLPHVVAQEYFQENFYERVWRAMKELTGGGRCQGAGVRERSVRTHGDSCAETRNLTPET